MLRGTIMSLCLTLLASTSPVFAADNEVEDAVPENTQTVDLSTITCEQFMKNDEDTIGAIIFWLQRRGRSGDDRFRRHAEARQGIGRLLRNQSVERADYSG